MRANEKDLNANLSIFGIFVQNGGSLHINGTYSTDQELLENEVILEGDRLEPGFSDVPGQWGTIQLLEGSIDNIIDYTTIKNATIPKIKLIDIDGLEKVMLVSLINKLGLLIKSRLFEINISPSPN